MTIQHAKDGYAFYRVLTPKVAKEYELPKSGTLSGIDLKRWNELQDLAEIHRTTICLNSYQTL